MKAIYNIRYLFLLLILFAAGPAVYGQQSDYEILQNFSADYEELADLVENADSAGQVRELTDAIDDLEEEYAEYSELLNEGLYPETFEGHLNRLRNNLTVTEENFTVIEDLNEQISGLEEEVNTFRDEFARMNQEAEDLQAQIEQASANEQQQAALIRQYRENIEQRNIFVAEFLEEMLNRYETMDEGSQTEISEATERLEDNPVELVKTMVAENNNLVEQDSALEAPDFVEMRAQQQYFQDLWEKIGERLANTFAPESPVQTRQEITDMLAVWETNIDGKIWESLEASFNQNGIELASFSDRESFDTALNTYVDEAIAVSTESNDEEDYREYQNFREYWNNTIKSQWGEPLATGDVLSQSQIAAIDVKLASWGEAAAPVSNLMFILFLISLAVIIGLVILLITKTKKG